MPSSVDRSRLWEEGCTATRIRLSSSPAPHSETAVERLTDDLLVEILSRVPAKLMCRLKCVSKHWLNLADHPDHRKKLPQTLAGFFYNNTTMKRHSGSAPHFTSVPGSRFTVTNTSFAFLLSRGHFELLDCCKGLLLCRWSDASDDSQYVVCNPATEEWAELPNSNHAGTLRVVRLCFDPAVSPHFHVFVLVLDLYGFLVDKVDIYSSESRRWVHKEKGWNRDTGLADRDLATVYLNDRLHFLAIVSGENDYSFTGQLATVDIYKGETLTNIPVPSGVYGSFIQQSQGRLHYVGFKRDVGTNVVRLLLYVLKDNDSKEWVLSQSVETSSIFGRVQAPFYRTYWIAIHLECNLIFFAAGSDMTFMCYDMDRGQTKVICNLEDGMPPFVPFVPLYAELQSLHK